MKIDKTAQRAELACDMIVEHAGTIKSHLKDHFGTLQGGTGLGEAETVAATAFYLQGAVAQLVALLYPIESP